MRHFMRYNADGELVGCDTFTGGWPADADLRDPNTTNPTAKMLREHKDKISPRFTDWAAYDCPCRHSVSTCKCAYNLIPDYYFNGEVIFPKPALVIEVDDAPVEGDSITALPESLLRITLRAAVPDGHRVSVLSHQGVVPRPTERPKLLTFRNGVSTPMSFTAPPQGITGFIAGQNKYVRGFRLNITGWA